MESKRSNTSTRCKRIFVDVISRSMYALLWRGFPQPEHVMGRRADKDTWIIISSDGLYANTERGGGGGFENEGVAAVLAKEGAKSPDEVAKLLALQAQKKGSTDDVTVIALKLGS